MYVCVFLPAPHSQLLLAAVVDSKPGERTSSAVEVNEGKDEKLHCCIQMPFLNCGNGARVFSWGYQTEFHSAACWLSHLGCRVFGCCSYISQNQVKITSDSLQGPAPYGQSITLKLEETHIHGKMT